MARQRHYRLIPTGENPMYRLLSLLLVFVLAACAPAAPAEPQDAPPPTRTPGGPTLTPVSFIPPDAPSATGSELLRLEGDGPGEGQFTLQAETTLRVHWQNFGETVFQVFILNTDPQAAPEYQQISMALAAAPSIGYTEYTFIPGDYLLKVETEAGEWQVWIESIQP
jgi:hypothetical protein